VPEHVETTDPEGVDYGWVMQTTFVLTIVVGAPTVAALSLLVGPLPTWGARAGFAIRVGAVVWILTAVPVFLYARRRAADEEVDANVDAEADAETDVDVDASTDTEAG
jgi:membrane protein YdbS with pleckstrin-like domain